MNFEMNSRQESLMCLETCRLQSEYNDRKESEFILPDVDYGLLDILLEIIPELPWKAIEHYLKRLGGKMNP